MKKLITALAAVFVLNSSAGAQTTTFGFEGLAPSNWYADLDGTQLQGFTFTSLFAAADGWNNFQPHTGTGSGWTHCCTNGYNTITRATSFFAEGLWAMDPYGGQAFNIQGWLAGSQVFDVALNLSTSYQYTDLTGFTAIDELRFTRADGTPTGIGNVAFDDLSVTETATAAPEPASLVLLATGLLGVAGVVRRRRLA